MIPPLTLAQALLALAMVQALFLALLLVFGVRSRRPSNLWLAALLFCIGLSIADSILTLLGVAQGNLHLAYVGNSFGILIPPLVLLHARSMMYSDALLRPRDALHLVPFATLVALAIFGYHLRPEAEQIAILTGSSPDALILSPAIPVAIHVVVLGYVAATLSELRKYARTIRQLYSNIEHKTLAWLTRILVAFLAVWLLSVLLAVAADRFPTEHEAIEALLGASCLVFVNLFFVFAVRQPGLFGGVEPSAALRVAPEPPSAPPRFSADDAARYRARLFALMDEERPYLDPELTIDELAARTGLPERDLSALLNESIGRSFYDFVNARRIEHAKSLLRDPAMSRRGVLEIMHDSGFRSKSAFYEAFRRHAGSTPAEFRKRESGSPS